MMILTITTLSLLLIIGIITWSGKDRENSTINKILIILFILGIVLAFINLIIADFMLVN